MEAVKWRFRHVSHEVVSNLTDAERTLHCFVCVCMCACVCVGTERAKTKQKERFFLREGNKAIERKLFRREKFGSVIHNCFKQVGPLNLVRYINSTIKEYGDSATLKNLTVTNI
jgi:hypothetical protein